MSLNGWPGKHGVPLNPNQGGWHWLKESNSDMECVYWIAKPWLGDSCGCWETVGSEDNFEPHEISNWHYIAPALTPAEVDARIQQARREALKEAARRLEELHSQHKYDPKTGEGSEHDTGYYRALSEGAAWILALGEKE